jgi:hypothetical protein
LRLGLRTALGETAPAGLLDAEKYHCERLIEWRLVGGRGGRRLKWELNEVALKEEEILDGRYWLVTTLDVSPKEVQYPYCSISAPPSPSTKVEVTSYMKLSGLRWNDAVTRAARAIFISI